MMLLNSDLLNLLFTRGSKKKINVAKRSLILQNGLWVQEENHICKQACKHATARRPGNTNSRSELHTCASQRIYTVCAYGHAWILCYKSWKHQCNFFQVRVVVGAGAYRRGRKRTRTGHQSVTGSGGLQARSWNLFGVNLQQVVDGSPESLLLRPPWMFKYLQQI